MQISSVNNYDNTNFKALKQIHIDGKCFKKCPNEAKNVLQVVKDNKNFQEFCNRWDVKLGLGNCQYGYTKESSLFIFYKSIKKSGFINSMRSFFGKYKKVQISGFGDDFAGSVKDLNKKIVEEGVLNGNLEYANRVADLEATKKLEKTNARKALKAQRTAASEDARKQKDELNAVIKDMLN